MIYLLPIILVGWLALAVLIGKALSWTAESFRDYPSEKEDERRAALNGRPLTSAMGTPYTHVNGGRALSRPPARPRNRGS